MNAERLSCRQLSSVSLVDASEEGAEEIRPKISYEMLVHRFRIYGARDCRCRLFEQICRDGRIDEQPFGMVYGTAPDFFGGTEDRRTDRPAKTVNRINTNRAPVRMCPFRHWVPTTPATAYPNPIEKAATPSPEVGNVEPTTPLLRKSTGPRQKLNSQSPFFYLLLGLAGRVRERAAFCSAQGRGYSCPFCSSVEHI